MLSPGTNPRENFVQRVQGKSDLQFPTRQFLNTLGAVPGSLAHQLGGERVKLESYLVNFVIFTLPDLEAVLEKVVQDLRARFFKRTRGSLDLAHAGENEYAPSVALEVVGQEIPLAADAGEMPRFNGAFLVVPGPKVFCIQTR